MIAVWSGWRHRFQRKSCTLVLSALLFVASSALSPAGAEQWQFLSSINGRTVSLDVDSIAIERGLLQAWLRFELPDDETEPLFHFTRRSAKSLWYFDCPNRSAAVVRTVSYSEPGLAGTVVNDSGISTQHVFFPPTRGTYAEFAAALVCAGVPIHQPTATG